MLKGKTVFFKKKITDDEANEAAATLVRYAIQTGNEVEYEIDAEPIPGHLMPFKVSVTSELDNEKPNSQE